MSELSDYMRSIVEASGLEIETLTRRLDAAEARVKVLEEALRSAQVALALLLDVDAYKAGVSTLDVWAKCVEAEARIRAALASKEEGGR